MENLLLQKMNCPRSIEWTTYEEFMKLTFSDTNLLGYIFHERIGHGSSASVYRVTHGENSYAAKVTVMDNFEQCLEEVKTYQRMSEMKIAPQFITHEICKVETSSDSQILVSVIVSELFDTDLSIAINNPHKEMKNNTIKIVTWLQEAKLLMESLNHKYEDIHLANIVVNFTPLKVRIVDFEPRKANAHNYVDGWSLIFRCIGRCDIFEES